MKLAPVLAALLLLAPSAQGEPVIAPDKPGIWGFPYDAETPEESPQNRAAAGGLSCLAEPALLEPEADGYRLSVFTVDPAALAQNEVRYYLRTRSACSYDPVSRVEACIPAEGDPYWSLYEAIDPAAGIYRGHGLADEAAVAQAEATGAPPADSWPFEVFYCPKELRPRFAFLQAAVEDNVGEAAAYELIAGNLDDCGQPLCGLDGERLRQLAGH